MASPKQSTKPNHAVWAPTEMPTSFTDAYTDEDKAKLQRIVNWLNEHQKNRSWLAALARMNKVTLYFITQGEYKSPVTPHLDNMLNAIATATDRSSAGHIEFVETETYRLAVAICKRARKYADFGIFIGNVGTGKTTSLKRYANDHANTYLVEALPLMPARVLVEAILKLAGITLPARRWQSLESKLVYLIDSLRGTDSLIIVDEAETLNGRSLHMLRRISDLCGIGIVLAGTERLHYLVSPIGGEFDQIRSRVGMWPQPIKRIKRDDADAVITAAFAEECEVPDAVYERLWYYCGGSMRMLADNLIPTVRDYGLRKDHALTVELVDKIATGVLNLPAYIAQERVA